MLFADSGGTKTDWCFVNTYGVRSYFATESYHPSNWGESFFKRIKSFWETKPELKSAQLFFYGAGCLNSQKAGELSGRFKEFQFSNVWVSSDLHGAGMASYGRKNGTVAIMGTGSVMFSWNDGQVENIIGGLGHEIGDEGSGYYFGKLILNGLINKTLNKKQLDIIDCRFEDISLNQKFRVARLASELKEYKEVFRNFHIKNIDAFLRFHIAKTDKLNLTIVGSYGFHHQDIISSYLYENGVFVDQFIERPINAIVEQTVSLNE